MKVIRNLFFVFQMVILTACSLGCQTDGQAGQKKEVLREFDAFSKAVATGDAIVAKKSILIADGPFITMTSLNSNNQLITSHGSVRGFLKDLSSGETSSMRKLPNFSKNVSVEISGRHATLLTQFSENGLDSSAGNYVVQFIEKDGWKVQNIYLYSSEKKS